MIIQHCGHPERMRSTPRGGTAARALTSPPWAQLRPRHVPGEEKGRGLG